VSFLRKQESRIKVSQYYVYILASRKNGTLYIGVTNDLLKRVYEHKNNLIEGFTKKYGVRNLVYYEQHNEVGKAITREKQIKKWKRNWKIELIEKTNPNWKDLFLDLMV
jgi:putative endonuclease